MPTLKAGLMAIGGAILGLGFALIFSSLNIAEIASAASQAGAGIILKPNDAISISFWLVITGIVLFPVGLGILAYGVGAQEPQPETTSTEAGFSQPQTQES